jgi:hypothetical protein
MLRYLLAVSWLVFQTVVLVALIVTVIVERVV